MIGGVYGAEHGLNLSHRREEVILSRIDASVGLRGAQIGRVYLPMVAEYQCAGLFLIFMV